MPIPCPTSLTITGTSTFSSNSLIVSIGLLVNLSPLGCNHSWSGLTWTIRPLAETFFTRSLMTWTLFFAINCSTCAIPRLAYSGISSPRYFRTSKSSRCSSLYNRLLQEPRPMPKPKRPATVARFLLIFPAFSVPPVILETQVGALNVFPRNSIGSNADKCADNIGS